jgi:signal peptidase I
MTKQNVEKLLTEGHTIQIKPIGYSMYPMFVPGRDFAILQKADPAKCKRGDVVLYRRSDHILVLHRIWKKNRLGFYMVGDNQVATEGPLEPTQIIGKLVAFIRKGKEISADLLSYRMAAGLWLTIRPFRRPIQLFAAFCKKILRKLK